jgi:GntR family transcriptional regulator
MIQCCVFGGYGWASSMTEDNHGREEDGRDGGGSSESSDERPKYLQVRDGLVERIRAGTWKRGQPIPSEQVIAAEFDVSPGTARKAILLVTEMGLLTRRQGSGTWVQEDSPAARYRFFSLFDSDNARIVPDSRDLISMVARANSHERSRLDLEDKARVIRISRTRTRNGKPFIAEKVSVPEALFPKLDNETQLPDALYDHYQEVYKILVTAVEDRLKAVVADNPTAAALRVKVGAPLLKIDRIAYASNRRPVEWRVWLCHLKNGHYLSRMGG